jgi:hypothetical protein
MSIEATHKTNHWMRASLLVMPRFTTIVANDPSITNYYFLLSLNIGSDRSNSSISRNLRNRLCNRILLLLLFLFLGLGLFLLGPDLLLLLKIWRLHRHLLNRLARQQTRRLPETWRTWRLLPSPRKLPLEILGELPLERRPLLRVAKWRERAKLTCRRRRPEELRHLLRHLLWHLLRWVSPLRPLCSASLSTTPSSSSVCHQNLSSNL